MELRATKAMALNHKILPHLLLLMSEKVLIDNMLNVITCDETPTLCNHVPPPPPPLWPQPQDPSSSASSYERGEKEKLETENSSGELCIVLAMK